MLLPILRGVVGGMVFLEPSECAGEQWDCD
jgi:hypothetical protein